MDFMAQSEDQREQELILSIEKEAREFGLDVADFIDRNRERLIDLAQDCRRRPKRERKASAFTYPLT